MRISSRSREIRPPASPMWIKTILLSALIVVACVALYGNLDASLLFNYIYRRDVPDRSYGSGSTTDGSLITIQTTALASTLRLSDFLEIPQGRDTSSMPTPGPDPGPVTLIFVGDVMLGRQVNMTMHQIGDFDWPFTQIAPLLRSADLTIGNLESPLVDDCPPLGTGMILCGDPLAVSGLAHAGFDGMGIANNHSHDYGDDGFETTVTALSGAGLSPIHEERAMIREINGLRVGIVAYEDTYTNPLDLEKVIPLIHKRARQVDVLLMMVHWGDEYHDHPSDEQVSTGRALIDAGVSVIIGSHPHWTQPLEFYHGGVIFYSLGNFVFDQTWSDRTRQGEIARLTLTPNAGGIRIEDELIPIRIDNYGQPVLVGPSGGQ